MTGGLRYCKVAQIQSKVFFTLMKEVYQHKAVVGPNTNMRSFGRKTLRLPQGH
jgi:hypothetical protein